MDVPFASPAAAARRDDYDRAPAHRPLALDAEETGPEIEDEIVRGVVERSRDADPAFHALMDDRSFGD